MPWFRERKHPRIGVGSINSDDGAILRVGEITVIEVKDLFNYVGGDLDEVIYQSTGPDGDVIQLSYKQAVRVHILGWTMWASDTETLPVERNSVTCRLSDGTSVTIASEKEITGASVMHGFTQSSDYHKTAKIVTEKPRTGKEQVLEMVRQGIRRPKDELTIWVGENMLMFDILNGKISYHDSQFGYVEHPPGETRYYEDLDVTINHVM